MAARGLRARISASSRASRGASARSHLFNTTVSANSVCCRMPECRSSASRSKCTGSSTAMSDARRVSGNTSSLVAWSINSTGSASPVASIRITSGSSAATSCRAKPRVPPIVQQMQPLVISRMLKPWPRSNSPSMLTSPYSFSMTAGLRPRARQWSISPRSSVVLPLPRNPEIRCTGMRAASVKTRRSLASAIRRPVS